LNRCWPNQPVERKLKAAAVVKVVIAVNPLLLKKESS
jgi:hypothetical protein